MLLNEYNKQKLELQKNENTCGIASIRNSLLLSFDYNLSEEELLESAQKIYDDLRMKRRILNDGIGPIAMAKLIRAIGRERLNKELKVFMTPHGNINQLEYFLAINIAPIIHRPFWEGDCDGHYEIIIGTDNSNVYLFNSARDTETSGVHKKTLEDFEKKWWLFEGEKWFLAYYPVDIALSRETFKGGYR